MNPGLGRLRPQQASPQPSRVDAKGLAEMLGQRVFVDVTIPQTSIKAKMRVITRTERGDASAGARTWLKERGYPIDVPVAGFATVNEWNNELAVRMLAAAVRDPNDSAKPLASLDEWKECTDDQIAALFQQYTDLEARHDPLGSNVELSEADLAEIQAAAKKGSADADGRALLMSFGASKLTSYIISSAAQPQSSPIPTS